MPNNEETQNKPFQVKLNLLDRVVNAVSPKAGLNRIAAKSRIQLMENSGYIAPSSGMRFARNWHPSNGTADEETIPKHESLRAGSRDLYMNNAIAGAILKRKTDNSVGWGLSLQSRTDRVFLSKALGYSDEKFNEIEYAIEQEFNLWGNSPNCDAARTLWFPDLQVAAFFNTLLSGDVFAGLLEKSRPGTNIDLCVSLIEGDMVCNPRLAADSNKIAGGIEVDGHGEPVAYHIRKPRFNFFQSLGASLSDTWTSISPYDKVTGRAQMLHLKFKDRIGLRRGVPDLAPLFYDLKQITRLSKAELDAAIIDSFFTVFVKSELPSNLNPLAPGYYPPVEGSGDPSTTLEVDPNSAEADLVYEMGSGNVIQMATNESIDLADPKRPNANFEPFFNAIVKQLGSRTGVPFEVLIQHFTASYSASRAALIEAWKTFRIARIWLVRYFNTPIYREVITDLVLKGRLELPGFLEDPLYRQAWLGARWNGISQGQLDPKRETDAYCKQIDYVLATREDIHAKLTEDGVSDWEGTLNRAARENESMREKNLPIYVQRTANVGTDTNAQQSETPTTPSESQSEQDDTDTEETDNGR